MTEVRLINPMKIDLSDVDCDYSSLSVVDRQKIIEALGMKPLTKKEEAVWLKFLRNSSAVDTRNFTYSFGTQLPKTAVEVFKNFRESRIFDSIEVRTEHYDPAMFGILGDRRYLLCKWGPAKDWGWGRIKRQARINILDTLARKDQVPSILWAPILFLAMSSLVIGLLSELVVVPLGLASLAFAWPFLVVGLVSLAFAWPFLLVVGMIPFPIR